MADGKYERGEWAKQARAARGALTQEQFAEQLGVARETVARWETGMTEPHHGNLLKIAAETPPAPRAEAVAGEPRPPCPELGQALRSARAELGWTQEAVAAAAGVSRVTLAKYEAGLGTKLPELHQIASALGLRLHVALWPRRAGPT